MKREIFDGAVVMIGEFAGPGGYPIKLVRILAESGAKNLTIIANSAGGSGMVLPFEDHDVLFKNRQVKKIICSFPAPINVDTEAKQQISVGEVELILMPQGNMIEAIRAGGAGIPAFYTPVGVGTLFAEGKETREFHGKKYMLQESLRADFALIRAYGADSKKNLIYRGSSRHFNPVMATAADYVVAEVDFYGTFFNPESIVTPGLFVDEVITSDAC